MAGTSSIANTDFVLESTISDHGRCFVRCQHVLSSKQIQYMQHLSLVGCVASFIVCGIDGDRSIPVFPIKDWTARKSSGRMGRL